MFLTNTFQCPIWLILFFFIFILMLMCGWFWTAWQWVKRWFLDVVIFLDKNDRWTLKYTSLKGKGSFDKGDETYILDANLGKLNSGGKALYLFSENKPKPIAITHDKTVGFSSKSLKAFVQNKIAQQIVKPTDKFVDMLILMGAIGGILAALASIVILLIQTGVIKSVSGV